MSELTPKEHYGKMVCLFLAEGLRNKSISLKRAVEIAEKVLLHINLMDTEHDFLQLIKEFSKDFEELIPLELKMVKEISNQNRRGFEKKIKDYVVQILPNDSQKALAILTDAANESITQEDLMKKYPELSHHFQKP